MRKGGGFLKIVALAIQSSTSLAAIAPFSEDFERYAPGDVPVGEFIESAPAAYTIVGDTLRGDQNYQAYVSAISGSSNVSAAVPLPNLVGKDFVISSQFIVQSYHPLPGPTILLGFGALASDPDFAVSDRYRIEFIVWSPNTADIGAINIRKNASVLPTQIRGSRIAVETGVEYKLTLRGTYTNGVLELAATAAREDMMLSTTTTATDANPLTGQYFGYRVGAFTGIGFTEADIEYDNFLAIPEPGSSGLALVGIAMLGVSRPRRHGNVQ